jgi:hypothetical protein
VMVPGSRVTRRVDLALTAHRKTYRAALPPERITVRSAPSDAPARIGGVSALAVAMGAELCIAFVILSTAALLVMLAPHP